MTPIYDQMTRQHGHNPAPCIPDHHLAALVHHGTVVGATIGDRQVAALRRIDDRLAHISKETT